MHQHEQPVADEVKHIEHALFAESEPLEVGLELDTGDTGGEQPINLALQVRNRAVEAYQELMRTQV